MKNKDIKLDRPWKKISSKIVYQNPFMSIKKDMVIRPDDSVKPFYVLDRTGPFSIIIPITETGETFLVGQYRYPASYYSWEFPMGLVKDKTPIQMAKIELIEETGMRAGRWRKIGKFFVANGHSSQDAYVYTAKQLTFGEPMPEEGEFLQVIKVTFTEIDRMIKRGKILDGPTLTALYFYKQQIKSI